MSLEPMVGLFSTIWNVPVWNEGKKKYIRKQSKKVKKEEGRWGEMEGKESENT